MYGFEGFGDAPVEQTPPCRAEIGIGHLTQLVVGKVVSVEAVRAHDAMLPQLVECCGERFFIQEAASRQHLELEAASDGGRCCHDSLRRRR